MQIKRKDGIKVYSIGASRSGKTAYVQAQIQNDKNTMGNATIVNICRPTTERDTQYIADMFGLKLSDIPNADLEMLE